MIEAVPDCRQIYFLARRRDIASAARAANPDASPQKAAPSPNSVRPDPVARKVTMAASRSSFAASAVSSAPTRAGISAIPVGAASGESSAVPLVRRWTRLGRETAYVGGWQHNDERAG